MELFEDKEDEWAAHTLAWWNQYAFIILHEFDDIPLHRMIFPDSTGSNSNEGDDDNMQAGSNSSRSKARQACLERAERQRHAAHAEDQWALQHCSGPLPLPFVRQVLDLLCFVSSFLFDFPFWTTSVSGWVDALATFCTSLLGFCLLVPSLSGLLSRFLHPHSGFFSLAPFSQVLALFFRFFLHALSCFDFIYLSLCSCSRLRDCVCNKMNVWLYLKISVRNAWHLIN